MSAFRVSGDVLIACNCDWGCPCNFNARPTKGFCQGGWIWMIEQGQVDGVSVAGLGAAVFATWPGAIHDGGGHATSYVDDRATDAQYDALSRVLRGELGGPWTLFVKTYTLAAAIPARFDVRLSAHTSRATIEGVAELELTTMRNPVSQAEVHPEMVLPEGLVVKHGSLAASSVFRVSDELAFDHSGQYAAFGRFDYA